MKQDMKVNYLREETSQLNLSNIMRDGGSQECLSAELIKHIILLIDQYKSDILDLRRSWIDDTPWLHSCFSLCNLISPCPSVRVHYRSVPNIPAASQDSALPTSPSTSLNISDSKSLKNSPNTFFYLCVSIWVQCCWASDYTHTHE